MTYTHTHAHCYVHGAQGARVFITRRPAASSAQLAARGSSGPGVSGLESLATVISVGPS